MRTLWTGLGGLFLGAALLAGCKTPPPQLKPAAAPEELAGPPVGDSRYDFPNYPKEALTFNANNDKRGISGNGGTGPNFGAGGAGMGGMGGGGMGGMGGMPGR